MSDPIIEAENPNDAPGRNPGDPTISLDPDGTMANEPSLTVATAPVNPTPTPTSDPCHVESPYQQPPDGLEVLKETARLREEALQSENRFRIDRTPRVDVDATPRVDPAYEPVPVVAADPNAPFPAQGSQLPQPVWDPVAQAWR